MIVKREIAEKDGKLCFVERDISTGICHWYPIRAKVEIKFTPNKPLFLSDPYLYIDRKNEI